MDPSRPAFTPAYGISPTATGLLPWSHVTQRLAAARNYWIATTRPDGRPHVAPVWGAWLDDALYFGTERASVKARNLATNPALALHLESGDDVVILECVAAILPDPLAIPGLDAAFRAKYGMGAADAGTDAPGAEPLWYAASPHIAFAWLESDFVTTATRWRR